MTWALTKIHLDPTETECQIFWSDGQGQYIVHPNETDKAEFVHQGYDNIYEHTWFAFGHHQEDDHDDDEAGTIREVSW